MHSEYYASWRDLLTNDDFRTLLRQHGKRAVFCMHRNMEIFEQFFTYLSCDEIKILRWEDANIDQLIHHSGMLITDFSSVAMDFAYMKRPLLYYQFDYKEFREKHLPEGYFDYGRDGFGPVVSTVQELNESFAEVLDKPERFHATYDNKTEKFYLLNDTKNCERTYLAIIKMLGLKTL